MIYFNYGYGYNQRPRWFDAMTFTLMLLLHFFFLRLVFFWVISLLHCGRRRKCLTGLSFAVFSVCVTTCSSSIKFKNLLTFLWSTKQNLLHSNTTSSDDDNDDDMKINKNDISFLLFLFRAQRNKTYYKTKIMDKTREWERWDKDTAAEAAESKFLSENKFNRMGLVE